MFRNYFKTAWRNISKSRFYSIINIAGLSVGIAFTLLISAYVWSQLQVNKNLKNADDQYIILSKWKNPNEGYPLATLGELGKALQQNYPHLVANYYRYDGVSSNISKDNKAFRENIQIGDSTLLTMYGFSLLHGNAITALNAPFNVVITKEKAIKYFGNTDVVGQTLTIENFSGARHDFLITGVLDNISKNSVTQLADAFPGGFFVSTDNLSYFNRTMDWANPFIVNYIQLQKGVIAKQLEQPIAQLIKQNAAPLFVQDLQPQVTSLSTYYLDANNGVIRKMLYALSAIALFILIMAVINFINMSISRSSSRMREIGVRKVLGSLRQQLIIQFLVESVTITFLSTVFAFIIYVIARPLFSNMLGSDVPMLNQFPFSFIFFPFILIMSIGCLAGVYPAFVLSSLNSIESLKGKLTSVKENIFLRKSFIAFQFATATIAFVGAIIISQQVSLFVGKDIGYNKDYIVSAQLPRDWTPAGVKKMLTIRNNFASLAGVQSASLSYEIPDGNNIGQSYIYRQGADTATAIPMQLLINDENYAAVYKIPMLSGESFAGHTQDSGKIVLNETAIKTLGFKKAQDAVGKQIRWLGDPTVFTVKGVTNDFHFGSMAQKVTPLIMANVEFFPNYRYISFKLQPGNISNNLNALQQKWNALLPGTPFEYKFMDETLANVYKTEIQLKKASYTAGVLSLLIVLLGVIGLISLSIQKRTKEIGIRKVLGSSVPAIVTLFIKEFLWVIVIGGLIACPLAYWLMQSWLQGYAYRIAITASPFVVAVICLGLITAMLIAMQTIKAAVANPVKSLRTE